MLNLMKYEFRRQSFSKVIIFGGLLALIAAYFCFYWQGVETGVIMMTILMGLATIVVMFYAPFEFLFPFDKDMNSKQGYMLLLVPQKPVTVLGAKLLVSLLQTAVIYSVFFTVVPFCERLCGTKFGITPAYISEIVNEFSGISGVAELIEFWAVLLMLWLFFSSLGMFVTAIPGKGKMASLLGFAGFVAAIFVVFFVMDKIDVLFDWLKTPELVGDIAEWVYMIGIDAALFFGTAKLLDKKVSL